MGLKATRSAIAIVLAAGALAGFASEALADAKAGVDAWTAGNYDAAVREWKPAADAGDPDAQFNLAQAYKLGRGVPRDLARAEALYGAAAAKGHLQAADNYGLLLFQRGERARAMPYVRAAAARGDARAQYILGLALFNGDTMPKDWIRAYAYVNLAQQQGLPQATKALAQMDEHIPLADRQKAVALAAQMAAEADATRARQFAAADLGSAPGVVDEAEPAAARAPARVASSGPSIAKAEQAASAAARAARSPGSAGADYTIVPQRRPTAAAAAPTPAPSPARRTAAPAAPAKPPVARGAAASGGWRVQLGAFAVAGNADALWQRVKNRPELAGHARSLVPAGRVTKLQATGFASQAAAAAACARLKAAGFACMATRD